MYVPAPPAQPAPALAPVEIAAATPSGAAPLGRPTATVLHVRKARLNVLDGHQASVAGTLRPGLSGRSIELQAMGPHGWREVAHTHTRADGRFRLRYTPHATGSRRVRLRFGGDGYDLPAHRVLGRLNVYRLAGASWYGGGGTLACGGYVAGREFDLTEATKQALGFGDTGDVWTTR
jgi:hypothetical protein